MSDCIFCKIASGEIDSEAIYRDDEIIVIKDINPQAPVHLLVIPAKHYQDLTAPEFEAPLMGRLLAKASELGKRYGQENGFRVVINTGRLAGQTVGHVHFHVLSGRELQWPPG
ncbi:MAG: histidine triad nucleotide-binding protein [Firmicutes bacterium]|nr:histidine triad nucleotide-binding protein [Bacillota bacterium]